MWKSKNVNDYWKLEKQRFWAKNIEFMLKKLSNYKSECNLVAYEKESDLSKHMAHYLKENPKSITVCIGPEGGFEKSEIQVLNEFGYKNCSLGKNILRAETAACYVLSAIEYQNHVEG